MRWFEEEWNMEAGYQTNGLVALQAFNLRENRIAELPRELFNLANLQILDLTSNRVEVIPFEIVFLENLYILNLGDNLIKEIPRGNLSIPQSIVFQCMFANIGYLPLLFSSPSFYLLQKNWATYPL